MPVVLAALPEMMIAIVVVLLIWAARALFGDMLSSMASRVPLLGRVLGSAVGAVVDDAAAAGVRMAQSTLNSLLGFILGPIFWVEHILADIWDTFDIAQMVIRYVTNTLIPLAIELSIAEARTLVDRALSTAENLINNVYLTVQLEIARIYDTINTVEHALENYVAAEFAAAEAYTTAAIGAETRYVTAVADSLSSEITSAISAETAFVQSEFKAAIAYTDAVASAIDTTITTDTSAITAWVLGQTTSLAAAIDLVQATTVAFALTAAAAVETDLGNLKRECTDNLCSGTGELASLLNQLAQAGWIAMLLGYAAWGAADPRACGDSTATVLGPIASGAKDLVVSAASAL